MLKLTTYVIYIKISKLKEVTVPAQVGKRNSKHQLALQRVRILKELELHTLRKDIYEGLVKDGLYSFSYTSFSKTMKVLEPEWRKQEGQVAPSKTKKQASKFTKSPAKSDVIVQPSENNKAKEASEEVSDKFSDL